MISTKFEKQILTAGVIERAFDTIAGIMPDPDEIFRMKRYDYSFFRTLLKEPTFDGLWEKRVASILRQKYSFIPTNESAEAKEASEFFNKSFKKKNMLQIFADIIECQLFGISILEIEYEVKTRNGRVFQDIKNIWGKPQEWVAFDKDNNLVVNKPYATNTPLMQEYPYNFILTQYWPTYKNPYGKKLASVLFWMLVFKKGGWKFFTLFLEKFGGAFAHAELEQGDFKNKNFKKEVLNALDLLVTGGVAVFPKGVKVTVTESKDKSGAKDLFSAYLKEIDNTLALRILGEVLTSIQQSTGARSATEIANEVRKEKTDLDITLIEPAINQACKNWSILNYGTEEPLVVFEFEKEKRLNSDRVDRDIKLIKEFNLEFTTDYISKHYDIESKYFIVKDTNVKKNNQIEVEESPKKKGEEIISKLKEHIEEKKKNGKKKKQENSFRKFFNKIDSFFSTNKMEKKLKKEKKLIEEFATKKEKEFQKETDKIIDTLLQDLEKCQTFEAVIELLLENHPKAKFDDLVIIAENVRYVASQIGAKT